MKIISQPNAKDWSSRETCRSCGTVVDVEMTDVKKKVYEEDRPWEGTTTCYEWRCPTCGDTHAVAIPDWMKKVLG